MDSRARLLGHPIHQMLVVFPLGLLGGAVVFDLVAMTSASPVLATVPFWLIVGGVLAGLVAAPFGAIDLAAVPPGTRARRIGLLHGIGNVVVLALFAASGWLRWANGDESGQVFEPTVPALLLSFAGLAVALLTAWLGGELVSRLGVGVADGAHLDAPSSLDGPVPAGPASATPYRAERTPR